MTLFCHTSPWNASDDRRLAVLCAEVENVYSGCYEHVKGFDMKNNKCVFLHANFNVIYLQPAL